jgi:valyl-tRNA synthetase
MSELEGRRELAKAYEPEAVEARWYAWWKEQGLFKASPGSDRPPYCITIPPPNITGSLHMGHALNNTILDVMTRWHRMRGFEALCLPGTDHAGIATQNVVERELAREGLSRQEIGREAFVARCWAWRDRFGSRIYTQFERLGCSYDWDRVRFTMDPSYVDAIMEEFRSWYERGLIYRGTRVVNWDVKYQSAVSDIEVNVESRPGKLYHFRYPFEDGSGSVTVATTRPETMLGDTAVAANPDDPRYQPLFGKTIRLPLTDRLVPLIADDYAKPEFGSGAVKVTPAHDLDDFECGLRHDLPMIVVIDKTGKMSPEAGERYAGLDRFEARRLVLEDLDALGLLEKVEDYTIQTPVSDRSGEIIEPLLSEQWFVDMKPLAKPAIDVVEQGRVRFVPERYRAIYLHWMENIRDWCISRQLWWGHRIPIWWTEDAAAEGGRAAGARRHAFARSREEAVRALGTESVWQDEDVLDTWFSSALWPHATLGWPQETPDLAYWYPTNLLSTAQEILYLWVARMVMTGMDFVGDVPFRDVYIHATVLDDQGRRMSKSLGNGIDPIDLIEQFGADATRFSLMQQAGKNQDIKFSPQRADLAGNFCNKLWNASRFVLMSLDEETVCELPPEEERTQVDRWILSRLTATIDTVNRSLAEYDMDDATRAIYTFLWNDFCDWYLEMAKPRLRAADAGARTARNMLAFVLETTLRLLHPITPFITEEIRQALPNPPTPFPTGEGGEIDAPASLPPAADGASGSSDSPSSPVGKGAGGLGAPAGNGRSGSIMRAPYPQAEPAWSDPGAERAMEVTIEATRALRNLRQELNIALSAKLKGAAVASTETTRGAISDNLALIATLARLESLDLTESAPSAETGKWIGSPIDGGEVYLNIGDALDIGKELERIDRELASIAREIEKGEAKLGNENFVQRAKPEIVAQERERLASWQEKRARLEERRRIFE